MTDYQTEEETVVLRIYVYCLQETNPKQIMSFMHIPNTNRITHCFVIVFKRYFKSNYITFVHGWCKYLHWSN